VQQSCELDQSLGDREKRPSEGAVLHSCVDSFDEYRGKTLSDTVGQPLTVQEVETCQKREYRGVIFIIFVRA
jgi:hypothetical protein